MKIATRCVSNGEQPSPLLTRQVMMSTLVPVLDDFHKLKRCARRYFSRRDFAMLKPSI